MGQRRTTPPTGQPRRAYTSGADVDTVGAGGASSSGGSSGGSSASDDLFVTLINVDDAILFATQEGENVWVRGDSVYASQGRLGDIPQHQRGVVEQRGYTNGYLVDRLKAVVGLTS